MELNAIYGPENAYYDGFVSRLATRGLFRFDPMRLVGLDLVDGFDMLARLKGNRAHVRPPA